MRITIDMAKTIKLFLVILLFSSCATLEKQKVSDWVLLYKKQVFMACIKEGESKSFENDISESINSDIIGDSRIFLQADSLGRSFYRTILPSQILDFENKKPICNSCLDYFLSKELDDSAKKAHREYIRYNKELENLTYRDLQQTEQHANQ